MISEVFWVFACIYGALFGFGLGLLVQEVLNER